MLEIKYNYPSFIDIRPLDHSWPVDIELDKIDGFVSIQGWICLTAEELRWLADLIDKMRQEN